MEMQLPVSEMTWEVHNTSTLKRLLAYGIPLDFEIVEILKYDTINDITFFAGEESGEYWECNNGAVERGGFIYVLITNCQVLKIDTTNNSHGFVVTIQPGYGKAHAWGDAILGIDGCIYWPPMEDAGRTLKYDPHSDQISLVGDDFGRNKCKWIGGALALDGVIYCIPQDENQILAIDPLGEFLETTKADMEYRPEEFGLHRGVLHYPKQTLIMQSSSLDRKKCLKYWKKV